MTDFHLNAQRSYTRDDLLRLRMSADDEEGDIEKVRGRDEHKHTPQFF